MLNIAVQKTGLPERKTRQDAHINAINSKSYGIIYEEIR